MRTSGAAGLYQLSRNIWNMMIDRLERRTLMATAATAATLVRRFVEQNGQVVIEAEHADSNIARGGKAWTLSTATTGYAGSGAMAATPNTGGQIDTNYATTSPQLRYSVLFIST